MKGISLKKRMLEARIKDNCVSCGIGDHWNLKPLPLKIVFKDGDRTNKDLENLEFVCPNCLSQRK